MRRRPSAGHHGSVDATSPPAARPVLTSCLIGDLYQALRRRDLHALGELLDPQVRASWSAGPLFRDSCGRGEVLNVLAGAIKDSGGTALVAPITIYAGSMAQVVVVQHETGRWNRVDVDETASMIFEVVDGLITGITRIPEVKDAKVHVDDQSAG